MDAERGRMRGTFEWRRRCRFPPVTSSTNSKQTLKSTISPLVFPSDGEQWLNTAPGPPTQATTEEEKQNYSISKRHFGTCVVSVCVFMCTVTLQGHTRNTVCGSSEKSPGLKCCPLSRKRGGGDPARSESLR